MEHDECPACKYNNCGMCGREFVAGVQRDAKRWRFLAEHWKSLMGGIPLHRWVEEQSLRKGGVAAALDCAIDYHENGERHIA
jgi:hypothetical protein